jgi:hypothetical protein
MLWQAIAKPRRQALRGFAGAPTVGRVEVTASTEPSQGPRRRS